MFADMMAGLFKIDPTKSMPMTRLPFDMRMVLESGRKTYQANLAAQQNWIEGWQAIVQSQVRQASNTMETAAGLMHEVMKEGTPEEKIVRQAEVLKKLYSAGIENIREVRDAIENLNRESGDMVHRRVHAALNEVCDSLEKPTVQSVNVTRMGKTPANTRKEAA